MGVAAMAMVVGIGAWPFFVEQAKKKVTQLLLEYVDSDEAFKSVPSPHDAPPHMPDLLYRATVTLAIFYIFILHFAHTYSQLISIHLVARLPSI